MAHEDKIPQFSERVREQLLLRRILVLDGVLDDDNGTLLTTQLLTLAAEDPGSDVALWINSPGGSVPSMLAIRDVMRLVPCDVSTLALGLACSAGQFLLSAGTKGKRFALPHARILMHRGSAGIGGSAVDIEVQADDLRHTVDTVLGLIAEDTGQPVERIFDDSLHDHWYTAAEARDYGFIDGIVDSFGQVMPAEKHRIGLKERIMSSYTIPNVIAQHPRGERIMDVYSHLLTERIVYLGTAIDPAWPTRSSPSCCTSRRTAPSRRSTCTSTARAATCRPCSPCTTPCSTSRRRSRRPAWARPSASARCCSRRARRDGARCCRTPGWCCTSPRPGARGRSRT